MEPTPRQSSILTLSFVLHTLCLFTEMMLFPDTFHSPSLSMLLIHIVLINILIIMLLRSIWDSFPIKILFDFLCTRSTVTLYCHLDIYWCLGFQTTIMAALAPPPNTFGVCVPEVPENPATLVDVTNAQSYTDHLMAVKSKHTPSKSPPKLLINSWWYLLISCQMLD